MIVTLKAVTFGLTDRLCNSPIGIVASQITITVKRTVRKFTDQRNGMIWPVDDKFILHAKLVLVRRIDHHRMLNKLYILLFLDKNPTVQAATIEPFCELISRVI